MDACTTRLAVIADKQNVIDLWRRCNLTRPWNNPSHDYEFALSGSSSAIIVLENGGDLMGAAMVGHDGHRGAVYYVGVEPDGRGQGLGRTLMSAVESWLRDQGVWKLNLLVREDNKAVVSFYEALGYVDQKCIAMGKRLDGKLDRSNEA